MRNAAIVFVLVVVFGVVALVSIGGSNATAQVQTLGVQPLIPLVDLQVGSELCEAPIALADDVDAVSFHVASLATPPPSVTVRIKDEGGLTKRRGVLPSGAGLDARTPQVVRFPRLEGEQYIKLCFTNDGPGPVQIFGDRLGAPAQCTPSGRPAAAQVPICRPAGVRPVLSSATPVVDGQVLDGDVAASFLRDKPRSKLALIPKMTQRAARFRPAFVTPGLWWAFLAGWLVLLPGAVGFALTRALSEPAPGAAPRSPRSRRAT